MRVEIIELLRCPQPHQASPLVTVAIRRDGDRLIDATLGCAVCGAEYALSDGVAFLGVALDSDASCDPQAVVDPERIAALLGLGDPGARVMLCGAYGVAAGAIEKATRATCLVVIGRKSELPERLPNQLILGRGSSIPLANASLNGLAVDRAHAALLSDAQRVVRTGGRVMAPAGLPVPTGCRELARDASEWVAEVELSATSPVDLLRARPTR